MTTLFDLSLALSQILQNTPEGISTGGSVTTLVDTARLESDTYYDGGTIWFKSGNNIGVSAIVTSWDLPTKTFTFPTLLAVAAGVSYSAASADYPRWLLWQKINEGLRQIREPEDDTQLVTVADQEEYTLPTGVQNVLRVEIATETVAPYDYEHTQCWYEIEGKLRFDAGYEPITSGYKMRLRYIPIHADLNSDDDEIPAQVELDRVIWAAALGCYRWRLQNVRDDRPDLAKHLNEAILVASSMARIWGVESIADRDVHLGGW